MAYYKVSVAEILKDKPVNTKLYSPLFGDVYFSHVEDSIINVEHHAGVSKFFNSGRYYNYDESEPLLFPSMEMRDWSKFAWKKGDVLVSDNGKVEVIFEKFVDDTYQSFIGKHHLDNLEDNLYYQDEGEYLTSIFNAESKDAAQTYINTIEERLGGKLNRETLEVEKAQPEFKDGDIVHDVHGYNTYIIKEFSNKHIKVYASLTKQYGAIIHKIGISEIFHLRLATEEEKQQLFSALAKEGKAWDAEKKMLVDLKPKVKFKPFDKIVGFEELGRGEWVCDMFSHYAKDDGRDVIIGIGGLAYLKALPFNEETAKLIGTTDD